MSEFDLIRTHFSGIGPRRGDVRLGVGDDCALLQVPAGAELAISIDTLVAGVHFLPECDPLAIGYKCLAVGLSDLASMGAAPAWATLALTLPGADDSWLRAFAAGFSALAHEHGVQLVGGDTTHGPLSITVQVHGLVPAGGGIRRSGACAGDLVCVSGTLGDAGLALRRVLQGEAVSEYLRARLDRPTPRVAVGIGARHLATAMIDVSDGLAADLGHVLAASGVGARIQLEDLPLSPELSCQVSAERDWSLPLSGGDDYELCFTMPGERSGELATLADRSGCPVACIGRVTASLGLRFFAPDGSLWHPRQLGFDHFAHPE